MYYNHNLRTNLQEWSNRLRKASHDQFPHQLKYLIANIQSENQLSGILAETCIKYSYSDEQIDGFVKHCSNGGELVFENEIDHAAYCYQLLKYLTKENYHIQNYTMYHLGDFEKTKGRIFDDLLIPIFNYLHDKLDKGNSTIHLLEKYKKRTEWFTKGKLLDMYASANKNYESLLEDDLRLFLFDQGIDYPFSTPKSPSGRADVVSSIDTSDPIIIEIKIVDKNKGYSAKARIKDGFNQIVKYTNDYNKDIGYLVIFNVDDAEINFNFSNENKKFPPMIVYNNKAYFFIVVNLYTGPSASNVTSLDPVQILEGDLIK